MQERLRIKRQNLEEYVMYEKSSRNYPKNKEKLVPIKPDDFKNMLKITHVRGAKQGTQKNKKALGCATFSLRTKSNLLETLVTDYLKFLFFFRDLIHCHCEPSDVSV